MFSKHIVWLICVFVVVTTASDNREPVSITGSDPGDTVNGLRTGNRKWSTIESDRAFFSARHPAFTVLYRREMDTSNDRGAVPYVVEPILRQQTAYPPTPQDHQMPKMATQLLPAAHMDGEPNPETVCEKQQKAAQPSVETAVATAVLAIKHSCNSVIEPAAEFIKERLGEVLATQGWAHAVLTQPHEVVLLSRLLSHRMAATSTPAAAQTSTPATTQPPSQASTATATPAAACPTSPLDDDEISFYRGLSEEEKDRRLIEAAKEGDVEDLRTLLAAGASPGEKDPHGRSALQWAAWLGHVEGVTCLLDAGAEVDTADNEGYRPMHRAAMAGHPDMVRLLGSWGGDPDAQDVWGWTPLHLTVRERRPETALALLEAGANKQIKNKSGLTPLDMAKKKNNQELIDVLTRS